MFFAYWMILAAAMLPYLTIVLVKRAGARRFDNHKPRAWLEAQSGWQQRGDWAHRNHFEIFPIFAAAVLVAELTHARQERIDLLAGAFILLRVVYTALYLADKATLRSVVWGLGFVATLWLFVLGA
ncbi:MAG TPA: MAPEG family protein [Aliidongia sp.]|uniref:MAPEG family protein n=1 Tax=Aliidongia sp. TaxID=1914230 RepID=UPI002DDCE6F5|nr:MAPEG family protein [Aliidongia sp.]HEV2675458.1 MAPEG family protein [Aliidongia sp.]